jgi:methionine synthase II (cobalamin-independent)
MTTGQTVGTAVGAHLVGGLKAPDAETAMRTAGGILGRHLHAVTDGETGERDQWIGWQLGKLAAIDGIDVVGTKDTTAPDNEEYSGFPALAVDSSVSELPAGSLGYASAAKASYPVFTRLREEGTLPEGVKFQVSVPTAYASVVAWVREEDQERFFGVYESAIADEVEEIARAVDHRDLVIQYDVAVEIGALSGAFAAAGELGEKSFIIDALKRALATPEADDVERGLHLCYGDYKHRHFTVPRDLTLCVELATAAGERADFVHMPADRNSGRDPRYYEPLRDLRTSRLALGVIDYEGDEQRTRELIQAATDGSGGRQFAVATECGMARIDERQGSEAPSLERLLELHALCAAPIR